MIAGNHTNGHRDPDTFDIRASVLSISDAARHQKWLVLLTCLFTLGVVAAYVYIWPPTYSTSATLMVERDVDPVRDTFYVGWNVFRKDDARTEIELMTSGPILKEVIEKESLTYDDVYHPFFSHLTYIWQKSAPGRMYRKIKEKFSSPEKDAPSPEELDLGRTIVDMHAGVSVEPVAESNVGRLIVKGPSRRVAKIANTLMDVYLARRAERHQVEAQKSYDVLKDEVAQAEVELKKVEDLRLAFSQQQSLAFDLQKEDLEVKKLTELEANIVGSRTRLASLEASLREVEGQLQAEPLVKTTATITELSPVRETLKHKRLELQTTLIGVRNRYREDSPEVQEIKDAISKLDEMLAQESEKVEKATTQGLNAVQQDLVSKRNALLSELEGSRAGLEVMDQAATRMRARLAKVPSLQNTLHGFDRELGMAQEKYKQLLAKQAQAAVSLVTAKAAMPSMRVVEYATIPGDKEWPKPKYLYPGALAVGLILGVAAALIISYANGRIRREHVEQGRRAVPVYGAITVATRGRPLTVATRIKGERISSSERVSG